MPAFQKLIVGALERLAKRQAELDELQKLPAKQIELMQAAKPVYTEPVGGKGLVLKHGTPFKFDRFDFENNLLKGEGALAFGPGGYMTGHTPLARQYAKDLYAKHTGTPFRDPAAHHRGIREAAATDPKAAAQYLRASQVGKLVDQGVLDGALGRTELVEMDQLPPHLASRGYTPNAVKRWWGTPNPPMDQYALEKQTTLSGFDEYRRLAESVGMPPEKQPTRIGKGGISPLEAIRRGRELQRALAGRPDIRPQITERLTMPDQTFPTQQQFDDYSEEIGGGFGYIPGLSKYRQNLNSTWRVANSKPGRSRYVASMDPGGIVDLRDPQFKELMKTNPELARRLYRATFNAELPEMLSYDLPITAASPKTVGALTQVADKYKFLDALTPDMLGKDFIAKLGGQRGTTAAERMRAMKEAGVPGMYFLRGGRRDQIPKDFKLDDYNFVIFDQDRLSTPDVEEFATGGRV